MYILSFQSYTFKYQLQHCSFNNAPDISSCVQGTFQFVSSPWFWESFSLLHLGGKTTTIFGIWMRWKSQRKVLDHILHKSVHADKVDVTSISSRWQQTNAIQHLPSCFPPTKNLWYEIIHMLISGICTYPSLPLL